MKKVSLGVYVGCVVVVLAILNYLVWHIGHFGEGPTVTTFSLGFLLGMLAMYIAVHLYRWK
jgi:hypothetical protein